MTCARVIAGKYRLDEPIGEGGSATVFRATHLDLHRSVAVKIVHFEGRRRDEVRERFLREARLAAAVQHRLIVDILDFGVSDDGEPFIVMELVDGVSLADRMAEGPPLSEHEALHLMDMVMSGLSAVHAAGVVHRDMKPENILVVDDDDGFFPKLLDFGVSRSFGTDLKSAMTTHDGWLIGTPFYMSPEQVRGLKDIDHRSDIYSLGIILYELLSGRLPFEDDHIGDLVIKIARGRAPPLKAARPDLGDALSNVVERAMAVDRNARFQDVETMRQALRRAVDDIDLSSPARRPVHSRTAETQSREPTAGALDVGMHRAETPVLEVEEVPGLVTASSIPPRRPSIVPSPIPPPLPKSRTPAILAAAAMLLAGGMAVGAASALIGLRARSPDADAASVLPVAASMKPPSLPSFAPTAPSESESVVPDDAASEPGSAASEDTIEDEATEDRASKVQTRTRVRSRRPDRLFRNPGY